MPTLPHHSYEELREIAVAALLSPGPNGPAPIQWVELVQNVLREICTRAGSDYTLAFHRGEVQLPSQSVEKVREIFWELFRQGILIPGLNDSNGNWPFFTITERGRITLSTGAPYRFHDSTTFISMVKAVVTDLIPESVLYLEEAVAAFYAGCYLASTIMLGVAAESEFLRLVEAASSSTKFGPSFQSATKPPFIRQKITEFQKCLEPHIKSLARDITDDLDTNMNAIQSVLRVARNDAGHPTGVIPQREQVYVNLQLFTPYAKQLMRLRHALQ